VIEENLPSSWQLCQVCDLGQVVAGGTPSTKTPEYWGDEIAWISPADLTGYKNKFIDRGAKSISAKGLLKSSAKLMPRGSVHFSSRAPIGYTVISSQSLCTNQGFKSLVPANGVLNEYVYYYFKSIKDYAESVATGTTFKELSGKAFSVLPVPLPPSAEQKRIVIKIEELFSELDAGEESFKQARKQLGIYRQSLLKQAFEGKLTEAWRKANGQLEDPDQLLARIQQEREFRHQQQLTDWQQAVEQWEQNGKEGKKPAKPKKLAPFELEDFSNQPSIPDNWLWTNLAALKLFSLYGPRFSSDDYSREGVYVLRTSDIGPTGRVNTAQAPRINLNDAQIWQYGCAKGDLLITRTGSLGTLAMFSDDVVAIPGAYLIQYRLNTASISPYLFQFFMSPTGQQKLTGGGAGIGRPNLNAPTIEAIPIPLCSLPEQQKIVRLLEAQFSVIEQNEREIDAALKRSAALRQSILKRAFSGQLVPQEPSDEPASELLKRIQQERSEQQASTKAAKKAKAKKKAAKKVVRKYAKR